VLCFWCMVRSLRDLYLFYIAWNGRGLFSGTYPRKLCHSMWVLDCVLPSQDASRWLPLARIVLAALYSEQIHRNISNIIWLRFLTQTFPPFHNTVQCVSKFESCIAVYLLRINSWRPAHLFAIHFVYCSLSAARHLMASRSSLCNSFCVLQFICCASPHSVLLISLQFTLFIAVYLLRVTSWRPDYLFAIHFVYCNLSAAHHLLVSCASLCNSFCVLQFICCASPHCVLLISLQFILCIAIYLLRINSWRPAYHFAINFVYCNLSAAHHLMASCSSLCN
jgi:hypothetical protein